MGAWDVADSHLVAALALLSTEDPTLRTPTGVGEMVDRDRRLGGRQDRGVEQTPGLRIGDRERAQVDERLRAAVGDGQLGLAEYDERCRALWRAQTRAELDALAADLPAPSPPQPPRESPGKAHRVLAVMSDDVLSGPVAPGQPVGATAVMAAATVDLRRTDLPAEVVVRAVAVMGETAVLVPRGVRVQLSGMSIMGSRSAHVDPAEPGAPTVIVHATSIMGAVSVAHGSAGARSAVAVPGSQLPAPSAARPRHRRSLFRRLVPLVVAGAAVYGLSQVAVIDDSAVFGSGTTHVRSTGSEQVAALFGSYRVVVPDNARVETTGRMLFGSLNCHAACEPGHTGPAIVVRGSGAFGSIDVVTESEAAQRSSD
ncbi:MAG: DUF1707 SHOCT-like domain-containing protein [Mycobacteriales bacterium]